MLELGAAYERYRVGVVIPVYNHGDTIGAVVRVVVKQGLHCFLVDDGSDVSCARALDKLAQAHPGSLSLLRLPHNQGKGGAVMAGLREARRQDYTHAVQIDADGQHDAVDIQRFLASSRQQPEAVICGCPVYDESVPKSRLYGRYATHVWVWINTLSFSIRDSMCGFRVYPLLSALALIDTVDMGRRMDFDTEMLVRLHWRGVHIVNLPTRVTYPKNGISHFRMWRDNMAISRMHALLFLGMLYRLPMLLWRKLRHS